MSHITKLVFNVVFQFLYYFCTQFFLPLPLSFLYERCININLALTLSLRKKSEKNNEPILIKCVNKLQMDGQGLLCRAQRAVLSKEVKTIQIDQNRIVKKLETSPNIFYKILLIEMVLCGKF